VMYPVDVIRALCMANPGTTAGQAFRSFTGLHGYSGFITQGLGSELCRGGTARTIKFWAWEPAHQLMYGKAVKEGTPVTKGLSGALATFPEVIAISPLENMKLAAQLDKEGKFKGAIDIARHLIKTRGPVGGLYIGYLGMQCRQCLFTGGSFGTMGLFSDKIRQAGVSNKVVADIMGGFGSGIVGVLLNCWAEVSRTGIQKQVVADTFKPEVKAPPVSDIINPMVLFNAASKIASEKGVIGGLYAGVGPKCVHLGGTMAIVAVLLPRLTDAWFVMNGLEV